jgi:hypothetical protein
MPKYGYNLTVDMLNKIRSLQENTNKNNIINESENNKAIAITDDPKFGEKVLTNQIKQFQSSVDSSAQFAKGDSQNPSNSPLIYMPDTGNIVFSGTIPTLNNLKWQFVLKNNTGDGCFVWTDGLILNKENLMILNKLQGFYKNWCEQWRQSAAELEQLNNLKD